MKQKEVFSFVLRLFVNRPPPKTRMGRFWRRAEYGLTAMLLIYWCLLAFPEILFARSVTSNNITFYSNSALPPEVETCAAKARQLLDVSELAAPERPERVFICNSSALYLFLNPAGSESFACSWALTDNVSVADADFQRNVARCTAPKYNTRTLPSVLAHEITHGLIHRRLGLLRDLRLRSWVAEGYCEYVAHESSFPEKEGLRLMRLGQDDPSDSFGYFQDRQMVRYLVEGQRLSFAQVVARADDFNTVRAQAQAWLRNQDQP